MPTSQIAAARRATTTHPIVKTQSTFVTVPSTFPANFLPSTRPRPLPLSLQPHRSQASATHDIAPSPSTPSTLPRLSNYPRPSPPGFLYPHPIVPRTLHPQRTDMPFSAPSNVIWYLPYGLEVVIFTAVLLSVAWAVLGFMLSMPPRKRGTVKAKKKKEKENDGDATRRAADKPREYAEARGVLAKKCAEQGGAIKLRTPHRRSASSPICLDGPADSPPNPFLQPPTHVSPARAGQPRTSAEWLTQRAAFFSGASGSSLLDERHYDTEYDIEALEAGTAPKSPGLKAHGKSLSWVDLGLDRVEGAVSGWVGKVARWTDDDEGVVLPVVNGRGVRAR